MLDEPISPELVMVDGRPAGSRPAEVEFMIDPLDARRAAVTAAPSGMADASSMSVEALLFQAGLITADQLGEVVRDSVLLNRPAAEVALERGLVSHAALDAVLAKASAPRPEALPFPLPIEALELQAVIHAEAPLEPEMQPVIAEQSSPVVLLQAEPAIVADLRPVAAPPAPLAPGSPFAPEALQALLASVPTPAAEVPTIELAPLQPVALPEIPVEAAIPPVATPPLVLEQPPLVVLPPVELELAAAEPVESAMPPTPPMVAELRAEPTPTPVTTIFAVLLRLQTGERIAVDTAASFEAAAEVARGHADRFAGATEWPFLAGRCIRPDAVVSVDIERTLEA